MMRVFVDFDGTITDEDTFDALVKEFAGADVWQKHENDLHSGAMTLRQGLAANAQTLRCTIDEADEFIARNTRFDPTFAAFAARCQHEGVPLTILSSGLGPLIERALERNGLAHVPLISNGAIPHHSGWQMTFRDESENGHDKAIAVRQARSAGEYVVFVGDGISDLSAALEADRVFVRRGRALEGFLKARGVEFVPFDRFDDIEKELFRN